MRKLIPLSLPSRLQLPSLGAGRRGSVYLEMPSTQSLPWESKARQRGSGGSRGIFSCEPEPLPQAPNCCWQALSPREKPWQVPYTTGPWAARGEGCPPGLGTGLMAPRWWSAEEQESPAAASPSAGPGHLLRGAWEGARVAAPQLFWPKEFPSFFFFNYLFTLYYFL